MFHSSEFRLGWKEALVRIGTIIALALSAWFFYSVRNDPDLELDRRAAAWCGAILFTGAAVFLLVQLLATALSGHKALGFIPWLSSSLTSAGSRGVRR